MPIILAVEPDHKQAARLAAIVRHQVGAELVLGDTTERALDALGPRVPDMVLVPALLSPTDDASLAAALRVIAAAAHVRTLTIPVLASGKQQTASGGLLSRWRRGRAESPSETEGCDPAVFAEQITAYLKEAAAERAERGAAEPIVISPAAAVAASRDQPTAASDAFVWTATAENEPIAADAPALDRWSEPAVSGSSAHDDKEFGGEPFGTHTHPPLEEVQAEAGASFESSAAIEPQETWDSPSAFETPATFDQRGGFEPPMVVESSLESPVEVNDPVVLEEPVVFDDPIVLAEPVVFEPPAIFEEPILLESPALSESALMFDSLEVVEEVVAEAPAFRETPVVARPAVPAVAAAAFERPEVLELMAPVGMAPWRAWPPIEGVPIEVPGIVAAAKADVPDWSELMASLRQDMERRRTKEPRPAAPRKPRSKSAKPAVDEWGFFDPEQCGFSALLAKLDEITTTSNT